MAFFMQIFFTEIARLKVLFSVQLKRFSMEDVRFSLPMPEWM
jgi:hypothetical protein